jgi:L-lactate utilization protein LutC
MDALSESAATAGWQVARFEALEQAREHVITIARDVEANLVVRSGQDVLEPDIVEAWLAPLGVDVAPMALSEDIEPSSQELRAMAERADIGITGVDYAIAETGSCVLIPSSGVSRLVSLLPPVHIAIVTRGQVLPSLDELFTLRRRDFLDGKLASYMNLITGPSRSADIEYTLVTGVHGPGEVHMVLVG